jgi:hypothetical protein
MKEWILMFLMMITSATVQAQTASEQENLQGEWNWEKISVKVYSQPGNQLLKTKDWISRDSLAAIRKNIPIVLIINANMLIQRDRIGSQRINTYRLGNGAIELYKANSQQPQGGEISVLDPPAEILNYNWDNKKLVLTAKILYKDETSGQFVIALITSYYNKKP